MWLWPERMAFWSLALLERPAVTEINLEGNKAIETDQLLDALRDNGLAEGQIFRQVILEGMTQELQRQYVARVVMALWLKLKSSSCRAIALQ